MILSPSTVVTIKMNDAVSGPVTTVHSTVLAGLPSRLPEHLAESGRRRVWIASSLSSELSTSAFVSTGTTSKFHHQTLNRVDLDGAPQLDAALVDLAVRRRADLALQTRFARHRRDLRMSRVGDQPRDLLLELFFATGPGSSRS